MMGVKIVMTNADGTDFYEGNVKIKAKVKGGWSAQAIIPEELVTEENGDLLARLGDLLAGVAIDRTERLGQVVKARKQFLEERETSG